jgi:hypothetical protein
MSLADVQELNGLFAKIRSGYNQRNPYGLVCKQGSYGGCSVLKLQKATWTNDPMDQVQNESGIFFSVWSYNELLRKNRVNYNIHALKLRQLKRYTITSRDFANDFREGFASARSDWPNVRVDYGPQTLMQGWIGSQSDALSKDIIVLMQRFESLSPLINGLLASRRG